MDTDERRLLIDQTAEKVIGCAYRVSNRLGVGFLEKVYENALTIELRKSGLSVAQQLPVRIFYDGIVVGEYIADLIVEQLLLIELKAVRALDDVHMAQCLNYLKATGLAVCLLMNFAKPRVEVKRIVHNF
jgi:GxxExxY protein